jgi:hypothetical protein
MERYAWNEEPRLVFRQKAERCRGAGGAVGLGGSERLYRLLSPCCRPFGVLTAGLWRIANGACETARFDRGPAAT